MRLESFTETSKHSNHVLPRDPSLKMFMLLDYKFSLGVIGTAFWRVLEILEQVLSSELVFRMRVDIYV
jgi:hypothetical protein